MVAGDMHTGTTLPFDAHNHVHMGPSPPIRALLPASASGETGALGLSGMAIMSTHPRDYNRVLSLAQELPTQVSSSTSSEVTIVPCLGVHPWFLHELTDQDWQPVLIDESDNDDHDSSTPPTTTIPQWIHDLEILLRAHPHALVGEIGLDGFHFDPTTRQLTSPMERQVQAFRLQMELAAKLQRPVSIHTVQCFGPLFDTLNQLKKKKTKKKQKGDKSPSSPSLPPKLYFHAYGGKAATIDQLLALCGKEMGKVYFGFAPIINFRSPKSASVIKAVGMERLVLETDHEDASRVPTSMQQGIERIATVLGVDERQLIEQSTANARDLYNLN